MGNAIREQKIRMTTKVAQAKLSSFGWYASGFNSIGKAINFVEKQWGTVPEPQNNLLMPSIRTISYGKMGLNWLRYFIGSFYIAMQMRQRALEEEKRYRNQTAAQLAAQGDFGHNQKRLLDHKYLVGMVYRAFAIFGNALYWAADWVSIFANSSFAHTCIGMIASAYNVFLKAYGMIKNGLSYHIAKRELDELDRIHADAVDEQKTLKKKELILELYNRRWKFMRRGVSMGFSMVVLAVVVAVFVLSNPMLYAVLIGVGVVSLITTKVLQRARNVAYNKKRVAMGLLPDLGKMSLRELRHHKEAVQGWTHDNALADKTQRINDIEYQICEQQWQQRLLAVDVASTLVMLAIAVVSIMTVNPLMFITVGVVMAIVIGTKIKLHHEKTQALSAIKPDFVTVKEAPSNVGGADQFRQHFVADSASSLRGDGLMVQQGLQHDGNGYCKDGDTRRTMVA